MSERQHHGRQQHRRPSEDAGGRKLKRPKKEPAASSPARAPTSSTTSARSARRPSETVKAAATSVRRNSKGILGLCDSFSSQCDLRGSRSASAVMPPGAGGGARTVEPVPSPGPNLRPKFPAFLASVAAAEDWPTARVQRVASLNAMAKVHILYENESRPAIVEADDAQEDCKALVPLRTDHLRSPSPPPPQSSPPQSPPPSSPPAPIVVTRRKKKAIVARKVIKRKRDVLDADVEIIDTRQCRRMASLNAQAIMAASYSRERSSRKFDKESPSSFSSSSSSSSSSTSSAASCELKVVHHHHQQEIVVCSVQTKTVHKTVQEKAEVPVLPSAPQGAARRRGCQAPAQE
ncbi:hypothetical protein MRX96_046800 [Rhipicephalus microplus]